MRKSHETGMKIPRILTLDAVTTAVLDRAPRPKGGHVPAWPVGCRPPVWPILIDEWIERIYPTAEDVGAPATHHLTGERQDGGILFLAAKPAGMLAVFGATQQRRINDTRADGSTDRTH